MGRAQGTGFRAYDLDDRENDTYENGIEYLTMEEINVFARAAALDTRPGHRRRASDIRHIWEEDHIDGCDESLSWDQQKTSANSIWHQDAIITVIGPDDKPPTVCCSNASDTTSPSIVYNKYQIVTVGHTITNTQSCFKPTEFSSTKPGAIMLVLVGIAILAAVFFFIKKRVNGGGQPKARTESFDFDPPSRANPNLSKAEAAAMAELMRIAYRVENEGDESRDGRDSYYPGQDTSEKMRPSVLGGPDGIAGGMGVTTPYDESRQANGVARMQSLGSESVAQLGLKHPVGRWVHIQRSGAGSERASGYDVPDVPAVPGFPDRYSTSDLYSATAR
ncbi:hypothetical protein J7T55_013755 [Diaporthe amygdali]|uniref:uncharacterized protein n=1 Tax=Phomopsis amygdali TaxID=1214568 RepID=UPI0022FDF85F|nr:uncharacterized protein J7T55_013755 [Diaporthe amygdali]KAJ0119552.1 hypothetical protein J7T55_013755 [Diaporthe amygdali]